MEKLAAQIAPLPHQMSKTRSFAGRGAATNQEIFSILAWPRAYASDIKASEPATSEIDTKGILVKWIPRLALSF